MAYTLELGQAGQLDSPKYVLNSVDSIYFPGVNSCACIAVRHSGGLAGFHVAITDSGNNAFDADDTGKNQILKLVGSLNGVTCIKMFGWAHVWVYGVVGAQRQPPNSQFKQLYKVLGRFCDVIFAAEGDGNYMASVAAAGGGIDVVGPS